MAMGIAYAYTYFYTYLLILYHASNKFNFVILRLVVVLGPALE